MSLTQVNPNYLHKKCSFLTLYLVYKEYGFLKVAIFLIDHIKGGEERLRVWAFNVDIPRNFIDQVFLGTVQLGFVRSELSLVWQVSERHFAM